jgi:hypothetical protein
LLTALAGNLRLHVGPNSEFVELAGCFLGQWLLVQIPLWLMALFYSLRIRHRHDLQATDDRRVRQFGLRQLMIFTAVIGILLGIGRSLVLTFMPARMTLGGDTLIILFLAVAAVVMTLPLLLASLLPRLAMPATLLVLGLIVLGTLSELPMLAQFRRGPGPDLWHLVWINLFTAAWVLTFSLITRAYGYHLLAVGLLK